MVVNLFWKLLSIPSHVDSDFDTLVKVLPMVGSLVQAVTKTRKLFQP